MWGGRRCHHVPLSFGGWDGPLWAPGADGAAQDRDRDGQKGKQHEPLVGERLQQQWEWTSHPNPPQPQGLRPFIQTTEETQTQETYAKTCWKRRCLQCCPHEGGKTALPGGYVHNPGGSEMEVEPPGVYVRVRHWLVHVWNRLVHHSRSTRRHKTIQPQQFRLGTLRLQHGDIYWCIFILTWDTNHDRIWFQECYWRVSACSVAGCSTISHKLSHRCRVYRMYLCQNCTSKETRCYSQVQSEGSDSTKGRKTLLHVQGWRHSQQSLIWGSPTSLPSQTKSYAGRRNHTSVPSQHGFVLWYRWRSHLSGMAHHHFTYNRTRLVHSMSTHAIAWILQTLRSLSFLKESLNKLAWPRRPGHHTCHQKSSGAIDSVAPFFVYTANSTSSTTLTIQSSRRRTTCQAIQRRVPKNLMIWKRSLRMTERPRWHNSKNSRNSLSVS